MELIIYLAIFIIGTLLGSFFSLAIYRIPIKQDITHKRSYCPKCNHRLEFWDMIPILSYIFLGGKCRYCKEKIRPRYICLEFFSGILFLLFAMSLKINIYEVDIQKVSYLIFGIFYISTLFIIGGIEKENHLISKPVMLFGLIIEMIYIIYLYIFNANMYKYVIYLSFILVTVFINMMLLKHDKKDSYTIEILNLCLYMLVGTKKEIVILSIITTLVLVIIKKLLSSFEKSIKEEKIEENANVPIGFFLCFSNILTLIAYNLLM